MSDLRSAPDNTDGITARVAALGDGVLQEDMLAQHIRPLFSRVLIAHPNRIYLANHSLGRPLDRTALDVKEALDLWYADLDTAWTAWLAELTAFRTRVAALIHAPAADCIIPKASAGQGLRTVLNCYDDTIHVATTRDEFNSVDFILKAYAERQRIRLQRIAPGHARRYVLADFSEALRGDVELLIVSLVFFNTGQYLTEMADLIEAAHARGTKVLLDLYHAAGALPLDVQALNADFAVGGCYKYLRGGPGASWLYVHPRHLDGARKSLDTGWFAVSEPFEFRRDEQLRYARGGDGWLESTPAVLPVYQARAGLTFTLALGVLRLRAYSQMQQMQLIEQLHRHGIPTLNEQMDCGAFVSIPAPEAPTLAARLQQAGVIVDAREGVLRICPDVLSTSAELMHAVEAVARILRN
jgi:kynureninase